MKEKAGYRAQLEQIKAQFDYDELSIADVCRFTGCCYRTAVKRFKFNANKKITQSELARQLI